VRLPGWVAWVGVIGGCAASPPGALVPYQVQGDAIPEPLAGAPGDPVRGREIVLGRDGNCLLCHAVPGAGKRFMGDLAPPLDGVGRRLGPGQLRLRIVDFLRVNPDTIMPSYYRVDGLSQVASVWRGKPLLTAQEVEDTVAFLLSLR
jgi:L-cysteine S-thiosulfotransferase